MVKLVDLVEFQLQNTSNLIEVLERELASITQRNSTEIETIANEKVKLVETLNNTDQRIGQHADRALLESDPSIKQKVELIKSNIEQCQRTNEVNGEALQRAQVSFNKLNNIMQQSRGKVGMTYNAGGQTHTVSTLGTNIKA
jgi:flagella synthesis protein FlgN